MEKKTKYIVGFIVCITAVVIVFLGMTKIKPEMERVKKEKETQAINEVLKNEFRKYSIKNQEEYEGQLKMTLDIRDTVSFFMSTPTGEAIAFFKNGQMQQIPQSYLFKLAEEKKRNPGDKVIGSQYYEKFDKFGGDLVYEKVYLVTAELDPPMEREKNDILTSPIKYQFFFFDKYGNFLFSTVGVEPIN